MAENTKNSGLEGKVFELSNTQMMALGALLPPKFVVGMPEQKTRVGKNLNRKGNGELKTVNVPEKRPAREKEPDFFSGKSEPFKKCYRALAALKRDPVSQKFVNPVESGENNEEVIDLKVVEHKLIAGEYLCALHLCKDIRKMINSHFLHSSRSPEQYLETFDFSQLFESIFKSCESFVFSDNLVQDLTKKIEKLTSGIKEMQSQIVVPKMVKDKKMTPTERKQLCQSLKKLDPKYLSGVLKIVKGCLTTAGGEHEFDLEKLPNKICRELDRYIKQCLQFKPTKKTAVKDSGKEMSVPSNVKKNENEVKSESEESSSSSSQSEEELPGAPLGDELWDREMQDFISEKF